MLGLAPIADGALSSLEGLGANVGTATADSTVVARSASIAAGVAIAAGAAISASVGAALGIGLAIAGSSARGAGAGAASASGLSASIGIVAAEAVALAVGPGSQYPNFIQRIGSRLVPRDDIRTDRAVSGALRQRAMYGSLSSDLTLVHTLSSANLALLLTFYSVNRTTRFNIEWQGNGAVYAAKFAKPPHYVWTDNRWHVEVDLAQA